MIGHSNDEVNFPRKQLLLDRSVSSFCKAFVNNLSVNVNLSITHLFKTMHSGGFLGRILGRLLKTGFVE